jgi:phosphoribosylanthranilate isomerase
MAIRVKICGLKTAETMAAALDAGADMVGLNFYPRSPRSVPVEAAVALAGQARGRATIVALLVDPDDATLAALVPAVRPDLLQLHGAETPARVADIVRRFGAPAMKAVGVREAADIAVARTFVGAAAHLLLDAKPPATATALPGGNGVTFDWGLVADLDPPLAFMLSGGLDPATVGAAVRAVRPWGVDVASGVESAPGVKDPTKIKAFVQAARAGE